MAAAHLRKAPMTVRWPTERECAIERPSLWSPGSLSGSEDVVRDQEQDVTAKRHPIEPTRIRPERASKVGRGGSRAPTMSAVVARNILDGILYVDKP